MWPVSSLVVASGILFSLFFASILVAKPCRGGANRYLAGLVLTTGISICYQALFPTGLYRALPHLVKIYIPAQFLIGPLIFLYVSALIDPSFRLTKTKLLHFLPFMLSILYLAPFFLESAQAKIGFVDSNVSAAIPSRAEEWVVWLYLQASLWVYSLWSLGKYRRYRREIKETVSNTDRYAWNWLLIFLVCILIILALFLVVDCFMLAGIPLVAFNPLISVSMTGSILYLGWRGMLRLDYISPPGEEKEREEPAQGTKDEMRSSLFDQVLDSVRRAGLYRSPDLTLPELAESLGYSRTELSRIINLGGKMNFYDFINRLRVEDVRSRFEAADRERINILEAAFESGFNTKSTFHASFKKWTGLTPSDYRKQVAARTG